MTDLIPAEKAMPIRYPSTANLQIDSADRPTGSTPWDFLITRNNSILNGFFTRIGTTELVLEWFYPNINQNIGNVNIVITYNAVAYTVGFAQGFYTVSKVLDEIVYSMNTQIGGPPIFSVGTIGGIVGLASNALAFTVSAGTLQAQLSLPTTSGIFAAVTNPDLRAVRYLDFVSAQLTYNQALKDASTDVIVRDVLARWYFAFDQPPVLDTYGFPILMGYSNFTLRRIFNPPKQIRWDSQQPIGQLSFQVYDDQNRLFSTVDPYVATKKSNWLMTLQASEV